MNQTVKYQGAFSRIAGFWSKRFLGRIRNLRYSLRSWRYCVGARFKFWRRSRVPKKGSRDEGDGSAVQSHSTILQRLRCQIALEYYTIPPATQAIHDRAGCSLADIWPQNLIPVIISAIFTLLVMF